MRRNGKRRKKSGTMEAEIIEVDIAAFRVKAPTQPTGETERNIIEKVVLMMMSNEIVQVICEINTDGNLHMAASAMSDANLSAEAREKIAAQCLQILDECDIQGLYMELPPACVESFVARKRNANRKNLN